jgi:integrase
VRLPKYVTRFRDRHGKWRYRYKRKGYASAYIKSPPLSADFYREIAAIEEGGPARVWHQPGSFSDLIARYRDSPKWSAQPQTLKVYGLLLDRFEALHGKRPYATATPAAIDAALRPFGDAPTTANRIRRLLISIYDWAIKQDLCERNPARLADKYKVRTVGIHTWTDAQLAQYCAHWPLGTKQRLAFALLFYTAQRRSDAVRMTLADIRDGVLFLTQQKTGKPMAIPVHPELQAALDAGPLGIRTLLESERGPFTAASFGNWFRAACDAAGLRGCTAHGLRKAMARTLAEKGATNAELKGVGGWSGDSEVALYTAKVTQQDMARAAMKKLVEGS